jgi:hypothetical protein
VLDDHHGVAVVDQLVKHLEQLLGVLEVQAGGRFVEDVERAAGGALRQLLGELHPLRLAAGQGRRLLADVDVAEANALQGLHLVANRRHGLEEVGASSTVMSRTSAIDLPLKRISSVSRL